MRRLCLDFRLARVALLATLSVLALASSAKAQATMTLAWDPSPSTDVAGYIVQYGLQSGNPTISIDVGNTTSRLITGLQAGVTSYFRVLAYDTEGLQSGPSNEVPYTPPAPSPPPSLSSIAPTSGSTAGGTAITVTGANFVSGATVRVGGALATGVSFVSATELRATTPAGTAGARAVQVTNPDAQSATLNNAFTYTLPAPMLNSVSPTSGPTAGGTVITLTGANFVSGATVRVAGALATGTTFVSATQLRATTPAGTPGAKAVQVTNPDAQSATLNNAFSYTLPAPTLTSVSPTSGSTAGGTVITLAGANFVSGATVRVGGALATAITFVTTTQLRATTPAGTSGAKAVQVTNPDAQSVTLSSAFTYVVPAPSISGVSPTSGTTAGGTSIAVAGANFVSGAVVRLGPAAATGVTFVSASELRAITPSGAPGGVTVQVINPDSQSGSRANGFTYVDPTPTPTLTAVSPGSGPAAGGTTITLTGTNFQPGATVQVGGAPATSVTVVSSTQARATTPAGAGVANVRIMNPDAQSATLLGAFTFVAAPVLASIAPISGPMSGGTVVTLTGAGFVAGATVRVGGASAVSVTRLSATQLRATTPAGTPGVRTVQVVNPDGQTAQLANAFTYTNVTSADTDGDGLSDAYENQFGLDPRDPTGDNGAAGDPDGDGVSNLDERDAGTHPRGFAQKYLAEGVVNGFFSTRLAIANPQSVEARVLLTFADDLQVTTRRFLVVPPRSRRTVDARSVAELANRAFSTRLDSDQTVVLDRLMTWDGEQYGAHAETAVDRPATRWYLAEGSTGGPFELFYLIQNPSATRANVQVRYLLPGGVAPVVMFYTVEAASRFTIWVDNEDPRLAGTDVSAEITSTNEVPIIVERSMYLNTWRRAFKGGHNSAAVTAPALRWFLAEGATSEFFSMFVLFANPGPTPAQVRATYLRDNGTPIARDYTIPADGRYTVNVAGEDPALASATVAVEVESLNDTPVIVERTMWWPATGTGWTEGHNAFGTTTTGARWLLAEGEAGGPRAIQTFVLIANTSPADALVRMTLFYEDGPEESASVVVSASRRWTANIGARFPNSNGRRFSVLVESSNDGLVVERAMYWNTSDEVWGAGSNAVATKLP